MGKKRDVERSRFTTLKDKTLENAIAHRIGKEFPRVGGERMLKLCSEIVLEVVREHIRPVDYIRHGQILWVGISVEDPPSYGKRIADSDLVPVILTVSNEDDINSRIERKSPKERLLNKGVRLCKQAYEQGALLSNSDLAELLNTDPSYIGGLLADYERSTGKVLPRRATVHDVGRGITHKRIICLKRYMEGKTCEEIARETYHSMESVDRYLGQYDRVRHCRLQGMEAREIAFTLNCSISLVEEYLNIDGELERKND